MNILVIGALASTIVNFRGPLLRAMVSAGHSVHASAAGWDHNSEKSLEDMGVRYYPIRLERAGMNPFNDLVALLDMISLISRVCPDIVIAYTIKPVIYGSFAAKLRCVPETYSIITGIGYSLMEPTSLRQILFGEIAKIFYRVSLRNNKRVFFQNPDDRDFFIDRKLVRHDKCVLINGSGVDLDHYALSPLPEEPVFLMISRLLADKGVREYAEAAKRIKKHFPQARFLLAGDIDPNPSSIRAYEIRDWQEAGVIEYLGYLDDVRPVLRSCRYYVLPSYREGTPRAILEAMSMGRPIITTNVPGCRETVFLSTEGQYQKKNGERVLIGENGFLVRAKDTDALEEAILRFLNNPDYAVSMAKSSREIAESKYDVQKVNAVLLNAMGLA